jgi:AcrR family transcriptional regulator
MTDQSVIYSIKDTMSPKPDVSEERKDQILNAAEEVFTQKGLDDARMDDIAEGTGLSKGTLYLYFKSKDDLIAAILDRIFQREFRAFENVDLSTMGATDAIWLFTDTVVKDIKIVLRLMPIAYEFLALAFRNKVVQKALKIYVNRYMDIFLPIIQRGIETGEFRQVDVREVGIAIGAIVEGTLLLWVYDSSMVEPEKHIRSGLKLLLDGILAPS